MFWQEWVDAVATMFGQTTTLTAIFLSLIFTIILFFVFSVAVRGRGGEVYGVMATLCGLLVFLAMGWLPVWFGGTIAFVLAVVLAHMVSQRF